MTVAGRDNISPLWVILKKITLNWIRLQWVIVAEDLAVCEVYVSRSHSWCKQRNFPIEEGKSNDDVMNLDNTHRVQNSIVERQRPGEILRKLRIQFAQR